MKHCLILLLSALSALSAAAEKTQWQDGGISYRVVTPGENWIPFRLDWRDTPPEPVWGDFGIEAPAGKYGFLKADGAVFQAGGRRIRLWGCCLSSGRAVTPEKENAPLIAKFLRQRGYNAVRLTHLDATWGAPLDTRSGAQSIMIPERQDRFFFLLNELKKNGIYYVMDGMHDFDLPAHVFRGWDAAQRRAGAKFLICFSRQLQEYHNDYLKKLFTTVNPYTGVSLADDPALAGIQLLNEIFLLNSEKKFRKYADFPASARDEVREAWDSWRKENGGGADFEQAGQDARLRFYSEMAQRNFRRMIRVLREGLGVKSPVATTSCYVGTAMLPLALAGDYTEGHAYYSHPASAAIDGKTLRTVFARPGYYGSNYQTTIPFLLSQRLGYQPYVLGEWNSSCLPERFDLPLLMSGLANIQDIDGAFLFQMLQCRWEDSAERGIDLFGTVEDPGILVNMIPAALAWHNNYVPRASQELGVKIPMSALFGSASGESKSSGVVDAEGKAAAEVNTRYNYHAFSRAAYSFRTFALPETPEAKPVPRTMRQMYFHDSLEKLFPADFAGAAAAQVISQADNIFRIDTPRYAALWGVLGGQSRSAGRLSVQSPRGEEFSVSAVSLDQLPLNQSGRILVAVASAACPGEIQILERRDGSGKELPRAIWKKASSRPVMRPINASFSFRGAARKVFRVSVSGVKGEMIRDAVWKDETLSWRTSPGEGSGFYLLEK